jgi:drug/metabolite transporter (DMT)-like permease
VGLLVVACAVWGANMVAIKVGNVGVSPMLGAAIRSAGAAGLLFVFARLIGRAIWLSGRDLWHGVIVGLLFGLEFLFLYWGLTFTHASRGTIGLYTHPFWVALGAHFLLRGDRLTWLKIIGLGLAFGGLVCVFGTRATDLGPDHWIGDFMELFAGAAWAATTLYIKRYLARPDVSPFQTLFAQLFWSIPVLVLGWVLLDAARPPRLTPLVVAALAYQTVLVAFVSYMLWFWMIHRYRVSILTAFTFLAPLFAVVFSGLYLAENLPVMLWVGLGLVAAGIYLVNRPPRPAPDKGRG